MQYGRTDNALTTAKISGKRTSSAACEWDLMMNVILRVFHSGPSLFQCAFFHGESSNSRPSDIVHAASVANKSSKCPRQGRAKPRKECRFASLLKFHPKKRH
ncbi:unnamed protein product [Angiostrongylus costaricensis]|uniref:Uncharacterized protein n=1 Tax=Angiostrongylus costaricensis TaxID=334426 RepID=A0A0R3PN86_ANGCS|nr:unnamed protein product [Angiostrongylus costaricensis]